MKNPARVAALVALLALAGCFHVGPPPSPTLPDQEGCYVDDGSGWVQVASCGSRTPRPARPSPASSSR
ncbi:MAG: hypothetical protein PHU25_06515 [Deltaproteobacteria bacterium]|nr:hypothetical protein [Deltaproteobacteria bacterium]